MATDGYWSHKRLPRRRVLAGMGGLGVTASLLACSSQGRSGSTSSSPSASGSQASAGNPQPGGTLNSTLNYNPMLDPHKQSSVQQQGSAGVMQRLFRFKTG